MSFDVLIALLQLPLAAWLSVMYLREAQRLHEKGAHRRRMNGLVAVGSITAGLMAWRFATITTWAPPELHPGGDQVTQTLLLVGLGIAYILLREHPRHTR